jgi:hypothetical protein
VIIARFLVTTYFLTYCYAHYIRIGYLQFSHDNDLPVILKSLSLYHINTSLFMTLCITSFSICSRRWT